MGTLQSILFDIALCLLGALIGVTVPLLPREGQRKVARWLAICLFAVGAFLGLYGHQDSKTVSEMTPALALGKFLQDGVVEADGPEIYMVRNLSEENYYLYSLKSTTVHTKVIFGGQYTENRNELYVLTTETRSTFEVCDPCESIIGIVIFKKENDNWEIKSKQEIFSKYDNNPLNSVSGELRRIGPDKYAFVLTHRTYGLNMRGSTVSEEFIIESNNNFSLIFDHLISSDGVPDLFCETPDGELCRVENSVAFNYILGNNPNYYDIHIVGFETRNTENGLESIPVDETYSFNGFEYKRIR